MKHRRDKVEITKTSFSPPPAFVMLAHRHLQKAMPAGQVTEDGTQFTVPLDLLRMTVPEDLTKDIEEVVICYGEKTAEAK
jgi:hypothetical protein